MLQIPIINATDVSPLELKFYNFVRGIATSGAGRCSLYIETDLIGHDGKAYNRYTLTQGKQSISVAFRLFTIHELPNNFQNAQIRSPRNRALIGTLKTLGISDLISGTLTWLNDCITTNFASGSHVYYALQSKSSNLHSFFYNERDTNVKIVLQLQL